MMVIAQKHAEQLLHKLLLRHSIPLTLRERQTVSATKQKQKEKEGKYLPPTTSPLTKK